VVSPILVALDVPDAGSALSLAESLAPHVGGFKVGLELLMGAGPTVFESVGSFGLPVFADAKLHDIPNTVRGAASRLGALGARWVTVHASGGREMVEAAVAGLATGSGGSAGVLVVTVLTSLDRLGLAEIGVDSGVDDQVSLLARVAADSGAEGVVCAVDEIAVVKSAAPGLSVVTPGIRPPGAGNDDQRRVATLADALSAGADMVVVGRAITAAPDVVAAAIAMSAEAAELSAS
jgi:orotidine-5'-phosphate decarboxylase